MAPSRVPLPRITLADLQALAPGALALALLVFAEGVLLARTLAAKNREAVDPDGELQALGGRLPGAGALAASHAPVIPAATPGDFAAVGGGGFC